MLTVLGGLAEFERELIRARTGDGRKRAKDRGVRFGRPPKLTPHQRREALARLAAGETQAVTQSGCPENDGYVQKIALPSTVSFSFPVTGIIQLR
jgi:DNA invertase Pin-like site-specific DNA recombinase